MTAARDHFLHSIRQRVNDLPRLIDALDMETLPEIEPAEARRLAEENERLKAWLCICPDGCPADFNPDAQCPIHGDEREPQLTLRAALAWRDAFEQLHARIQRDFNFDASESAAPDDEYWARLMDDVVRFADELHPEIESGS